MPIRNSMLIEAANRAEATAILIRAEYRVYRPEADVDAGDLVVCTPKPKKRLLHAVQLKGRPHVERRHLGKDLFMLFPDPQGVPLCRAWYLIPHDELYSRLKTRHGHTGSWRKGVWNARRLSAALRQFLEPYRLPMPRRREPARKPVNVARCTARGRCAVPRAMAY
jgi:hypothetical protein